MEPVQAVLDVLPMAYQEALRGYGRPINELRLRLGFPPTVLSKSRERILPVRTGFGLVTRDDLENVLLCASEQSVYSVSETMREGFLTLPGGHRIGICGTLALRDGETVSVRDVSSLCIRVSGEPSIRTEHLLERLTEPTLILGPPGSGKTTLLRACIRLLSDAGRRVSLADDRGEVAACWHGVPQRNVGMHTDVLTGGRKMQSVLWLLRTMNPEWIAVDEITAPGDLESMETCSYCGVRLLATAHASGTAELNSRPLYKRLLALQLFHQVFVLDETKQFYVERMD